MTTGDGLAQSRQQLPRNALGRFAASIISAAFMLLTSVAVARALGPEGKGTVVTLSYLAVVAGAVTSLGLGQAHIVLVGQRRTGQLRMARVSTTATLATGTAGAIILAGLTWLLFRPALDRPVLVAWGIALATVMLALFRTLTGIVESRGGILEAGMAYAWMAAVNAAATVAFLYGLGWGLGGAILAQAVGPVAGTALLGRHARRLLPGFGAGLGWDAGVVRRAARLGAPIASSELIRMLFRRVDVILVYWLAGPAAAGLYSVALTVGELVTYAPGGLRMASFPAVAGVAETETAPLVLRITRVSAAAGIVLGLVIMPLLPVAIPRVFGAEFAPATLPALVLVVGGVLLAVQSSLAHSLAARGHPRLLLTSFAVTLGLMIAMDLVAIPLFGVMGAAVVSTLASLLGIGVAIRLAPPSIRDLGAQALLPRPQDFLALVTVSARMVRAARADDAGQGL